MGKITFEDDCLPGKIYLNLHYVGKNPFSVYDRIKGLMKFVWEVESKDWWERVFRYDKTDGSFHTTMFIERALDTVSTLTIEIQMQGVEPLDGSEGWVDINFGGVIKTTFGGSSVLADMNNPMYRLMVRLYRLWFYDEQRRFYLKHWCNEKLYQFRRYLQEALNIRPEQGESLLEQQEVKVL
jgi:hypothetical protein